MFDDLGQKAAHVSPTDTNTVNQLRFSIFAEQVDLRLSAAGYVDVR